MLKSALKAIAGLTKGSARPAPAPAAASSAADAQTTRYAEVLERIKRPLDMDHLARLREKYADPRYDGYLRKKFLNIDYYLTKNIRHADEIGLLDASSPKKVLDLGSGCGFFAYICAQHGHTVRCLDIVGTDIFDDMMQFFGQTCIDQRIEPLTPLNLPWSGFDVVAGLMIKFDAIGDDNRYAPAEWRFILNDLDKNCLKPDGTVYFEFNKTPDIPEIEDANIRAFKRWGAVVTGPGLRQAHLLDLNAFRAAAD